MTTKVSSRLIGALFLAGFVVYGVGFSLVTSVIGKPDFLSTISAHQTTLVLGAFLMLLNTVVDVGKGVSVLPDPGEPRQANRAGLSGRSDCPGRLAGRRGALSSDDRSLRPVRCWRRGGEHGLGHSLGSILTLSNTMAYQIGQATLGVGAFLSAFPTG